MLHRNLHSCIYVFLFRVLYFTGPLLTANIFSSLWDNSIKITLLSVMAQLWIIITCVCVWASSQAIFSESRWMCDYRLLGAVSFQWVWDLISQFFFMLSACCWASSPAVITLLSVSALMGLFHSKQHWLPTECSCSSTGKNTKVMGLIPREHMY